MADRYKSLERKFIPNNENRDSASNAASYFISCFNDYTENSQSLLRAVIDPSINDHRLTEVMFRTNIQEDFIPDDLKGVRVAFVGVEEGYHYRTNLFFFREIGQNIPIHIFWSHMILVTSGHRYVDKSNNY